MSTVASVLSLVVLTALGIALIQMVNALFAQARKHYHHNYYRDMLLLDVLVVILYVMLSALVVYLYVALGYESLVLFGTVVILMSISLVLLTRYIWRHREGLVYGYVALLGLWFAAVLYLTLFSRIGGGHEMQPDMTPFRGVTAALEQRSLQPLGHFGSNILMFIPFGYLVPQCHPRALSRAGFAILGGLMISTVIESLQMMLGLGFCDIDDMIANTLGAVVGYGACQLFRQVQRNWKVS